MFSNVWLVQMLCTTIVSCSCGQVEMSVDGWWTGKKMKDQVFQNEKILSFMF